MVQTTVVHILIERLEEENKIKIDFPKEIKGNLVEEHNWCLFNPDGPKLMTSFPKEFDVVCKELDYAIKEGVAYFDDKNGLINYRL